MTFVTSIFALVGYLGSAALVAAGAAAWVFKTFSEKWLQANFDERLERVESELRRDEEKWSAELKARDEQIASLREGAMSNLMARRSSLDKRKLDAADRVWTAVISRSTLRGAARLAAAIKMEDAIPAAAKNDPQAEKLKQFGDILWNVSKLDTPPDAKDGEAERPFISPVSWALFSTYKVATAIPAALIASLRLGTGMDLLLPRKKMMEPIKAALPDWADYLDKWGFAALPLALDLLEERLSAQLLRDLDGGELDADAVARASAILKLVEAVSPPIAEIQEPPAAFRATTPTP